jgi:hypothetical protein
MKKSVSFIVALMLAGSASLAAAQFGTAGNSLANSTGWNSGMPAQPALGPLPQLAPYPSPATPNLLLNNCDFAGCWGANGTRYTRAGNTLFGSNGKICSIAAPGAPAMCD